MWRKQMVFKAVLILCMLDRLRCADPDDEDEEDEAEDESTDDSDDDDQSSLDALEHELDDMLEG